MKNEYGECSYVEALVKFVLSDASLGNSRKKSFDFLTRKKKNAKILLSTSQDMVNFTRRLWIFIA